MNAHDKQRDAYDDEELSDEERAAVDADVAEEFPDFDDAALDAMAAAQPKRADFKRADHVELAATLLDEINEAGPRAVFDLGALHCYDERTGLWVPRGTDEQSRVVQGFAGRLRPTDDGPKPLKIKASDVRGTIQLAADQAARTDFFHDAPRGIAFADRFVRVEPTGHVIVEQHSPDHRARLGYPFPYTTTAPVRWLQFLEEVFRDDADKQERVAFIHEFFGACLLGIAPRFNRCVIFVGLGGEGKGSFLKIMIAAMPAGSTCAIAPQQLSGEYYRAQLAGKLLNAVSELPEADILQSESFKAIVSGDMIDGRTIRESPFSFHPTAGHAFSANRLPGTTDTTAAFWDRFMVLPFTRRIRGTGADDVNIVEKILRAELPAIVASLVQSGARMLRAKAYTIPPSHHAALEQWRRSADQVAMFLEECTRPAHDARPSTTTPHDWMRADALYSEYRRWADASGHRPPLAINKLTARVAALGVATTKTNRGHFYAVRLPQPGEVTHVTHSVTHFEEN